MTQETHATRNCEQCSRRFALDNRAPHKRFCSLKCKTEFWNQARQQGAEARRSAGAA